MLILDSIIFQNNLEIAKSISSTFAPLNAKYFNGLGILDSF